MKLSEDYVSNNDTETVDQSEDSYDVWIIIGVVAAVIILLIVILILYRKRRQRLLNEKIAGNPMKGVDTKAGPVPLAPQEDEDLTLSVSAQAQRAEAVARMREDHDKDSFASSEDLQEYAEEQTAIELLTSVSLEQTD